MDEESAWVDAARFATKVWRHPRTHSTLFILSCTCVLTAAALHSGTYYTPTGDVIVYCLIYSLWLTVCLPWLVKHLDKKTVLLVLGVLFRLFAAEAGVLAWGLLRGHGHFLQRALRLKPLLEPSLLWLADAGYNLRYGVIVSVLVAAILVTLTETMENYNRRLGNGTTNDFLCFPSHLDHRNNATAHEQRKDDVQDIQDIQPQNVVRRDDSFHSRCGQAAQAEDRKPPRSASDISSRRRHNSSPATSPAELELTSVVSSSSPRRLERNRKSSQRRDERSGMRRSMGDGAATEENQDRSRCCHVSSKCHQFGDGSSSFSSTDALMPKSEGHKNQDQGQSLGQGLDSPGIRLFHVKGRDLSPREGSDEVNSNRHSSLLAGTGSGLTSAAAARTSLKARPSSSFGSSITTDLECREQAKWKQGQRSGRRSCPTEFNFSPRIAHDRKRTRGIRSRRGLGVRGYYLHGNRMTHVGQEGGD